MEEKEKKVEELSKTASACEGLRSELDDKEKELVDAKNRISKQDEEISELKQTAKRVDDVEVECRLKMKRSLNMSKDLKKQLAKMHMMYTKLEKAYVVFERCITYTTHNSNVTKYSNTGTRK